jgi:hypothetical protein
MNRFRTVLAVGKVIVVVGLVVLLSVVSGRLMGGKGEEKGSEKPTLSVRR